MAARLKTMTDKFDKEAAVMSESDRGRRQRELAEIDKDFQRKQREFREDLNQRRNEELAIVLEKANATIRSIAEQEKYDLILQEAVHVSGRIDITDKMWAERSQLSVRERIALTMPRPRRTDRSCMRDDLP